MCHTKSPVHQYLRNIKSSTMQLRAVVTHFWDTDVCVTSMHSRNCESGTLLDFGVVHADLFNTPSSIGFYKTDPPSH